MPKLNVNSPQDSQVLFSSSTERSEPSDEPFERSEPTLWPLRG